MRARDFLLGLGCLLFPALALTSTPLLGGCAESYDPSQKTNVLAPDYDIYATYLDEYINRRCGTLDCHGATGRAFRHYGALGLRRLEGKADEFTGEKGDAGEVRRTGLGATTEEEVRANYAGIIALEPEVISRLVALNGNDINARALEWMFLRKGLGLSDTTISRGERHKGGEVFKETDDAYKCIVLWLRARTKPATWKNGASDGGTSGDAGRPSRGNPSTPEEKDYNDYLDRFDRECALKGFR